MRGCPGLPQTLLCLHSVPQKRNEAHPHTTAIPEPRGQSQPAQDPSAESYLLGTSALGIEALISLLGCGSQPCLRSARGTLRYLRDVFDWSGMEHESTPSSKLPKRLHIPARVENADLFADPRADLPPSLREPILTSRARLQLVCRSVSASLST